MFGAAFAGGWALAILFGLGDTGAHILQAVLFAIGVFVMVGFIRAAQRVEPFFKRALMRAEPRREAAAAQARTSLSASSQKNLTSVHVQRRARVESGIVSTR